MLTKQRKQHILRLLEQSGQIVAKEISSALGVSEDTIRRDLRELARDGRLQRVHGGALPSSPAVADFAGRERLRHEGKIAIGKAAASVILPGHIVILDGGTTAREIARHLPLDLDATVATHSPTIAMELIHHASIEVILIGGRLLQHSVVAVGAAAIEAISHLHADTFFMGVTGVHPRTGLTTGDFEEAAVKRALSRAAAETVVLASAEKLNAASAFKIVGLEEVSALITERDASDDQIKPYQDLGISVFRV